MNTDTKFDLNDVVYPIAEQMHREWAACTFCEGSEIRLLTDEEPCLIVGKDGSAIRCPKCQGIGGRYRFLGRKWEVCGKRTVCEIEIKLSEQYSVDRIESYMCQIEGEQVAHSFACINVLGSEEEAKKECEARND